MTAELYWLKATMQIDRKQYPQAVETLKQTISQAEQEGDTVTKVQASCVLGEYLFITQQYAQAEEHLAWIDDESEELEHEHDDLLDDEIVRAQVLLDIIERFALVP